ncbi:hypothetical protein D3C78_475020 [compost metagenome]
MPGLAAHAQFQPEHQQAHEQQHRREHGGVGVAELQFELLVDRRGERLQAENRQGAELHQHVQGNQQAAANDRRPQQRQGDAPEHAPARLPQGARRLFQRGIEVTQGRGYRQEHQRVLGQAHHQDGAAQAFEARAQRHPGKAADKGRHGERQAQDHTPQAPPGQVTALQQPGQGYAQGHAGQGDSGHQHQGVAHQAPNERAPEQVQGFAPAGFPGFQGHIQQG